ncbi:hypothetical protein HPP92_018135 [Vanilla planifolia]|uniref:Uncharacterized protein n=1 Tax=Vanilla planifolia TaxID=51239 RepID=A0A835QJD2_VANPL|nr:hypothetical protein HPP92_018135 [Vanilla planifolia]
MLQDDIQRSQPHLPFKFAVRGQVVLKGYLTLWHPSHFRKSSNAIYDIWSSRGNIICAHEFLYILIIYVLMNMRCNTNNYIFVLYTRVYQGLKGFRRAHVFWTYPNFSRKIPHKLLFLS